MILSCNTWPHIGRCSKCFHPTEIYIQPQVYTCTSRATTCNPGTGIIMERTCGRCVNFVFVLGYVQSSMSRKNVRWSAAPGGVCSGAENHGGGCRCERLVQVLFVAVRECQWQETAYCSCNRNEINKRLVIKKISCTHYLFSASNRSGGAGNFLARARPCGLGTGYCSSCGCTRPHRRNVGEHWRLGRQTIYPNLSLD